MLANKSALLHVIAPALQLVLFTEFVFQMTSGTCSSTAKNPENKVAEQFFDALCGRLDSEGLHSSIL